MRAYDGQMKQEVYRGLFGRVLKASSAADISSLQPVAPVDEVMAGQGSAGGQDGQGGPAAL